MRATNAVRFCRVHSVKCLRMRRHHQYHRNAMRCATGATFSVKKLAAIDSQRCAQIYPDSVKPCSQHGAADSLTAIPPRIDPENRPRKCSPINCVPFTGSSCTSATDLRALVEFGWRTLATTAMDERTNERTVGVDAIN